MKISLLVLAVVSVVACQANGAIDITAELAVNQQKKEAPPTDAPMAGAMTGAPAAKGTVQDKILKISVRNVGTKPEPGLTVRYWFFGRDMKANKTVVVDGAESTLNLKANGTEVILSEPVKSSYTQKTSFAGGAKATQGAKPPEAGGVKIAGYGIQAIKEGKVIGERFSEGSFKQVIGSNGAKPGEPYVKPEKPEPAAENP